MREPLKKITKLVAVCSEHMFFGRYDVRYIKRKHYPDHITITFERVSHDRDVIVIHSCFSMTEKVRERSFNDFLKLRS
jgi:hypothetical protein